MKHFTSGILVLILITVACTASARSFKFRNYQVNHGLSENTVQAILQDRQGFIWLGTKDGLNRFDGNEFRIFRNDPLSGKTIGNSFVRSIMEDSEGKLWIGTDRQLYIYHPSSEDFTLFDQKTAEGIGITSEVHSICAENENTIWIGTGTQGVFCYYRDKDSLAQIVRSTGDTRQIGRAHV